MRTLLISFMLFSLSGFSSADVLTSLPDGIYSGQGNWSDKSGGAGSYEAKIEFSKNNMSINYNWGDGALLSLNLVFSFKENGWFDVSLLDNKSGKGFCTKNVCQYYVKISDDAKYGETIVFAEDHLLKSGYKVVGDHVVRWEETLYPQ